MLKPKQLLKRTTTGLGAFIGRESALSEVQVTAVGSGAVNATVKLWGSNDEVGRVDLGDVSASGTNVATGTDSIERAYSVIQAELITVSANTEVTVTFSDAMCGGD